MDDEALPKPDELLALDGVTTEMFAMLRRWFSVPETISLNLAAIDSAVTEMGDPVLIAAMAMRKLQALHLLATPGVRTTTDVIVTIVQDLDRALVQAPNMRLNLAAQQTDWDAALASLDVTTVSDGGETDESVAVVWSSDVGSSDVAPRDVAPSDVNADDPEATRFRELHQQLHEAVYAVVSAAANEIRYFL